MALRLHQIKVQYFTDTLFAGVKSLTSDKSDQLCTDVEYIYINPMKLKKEAGDIIHNFTNYVGIPAVKTRENYGEQTGNNTKSMKLINKHFIGDITAEPYYPCKNLA